jgi:MFS family permease
MVGAKKTKRSVEAARKNTDGSFETQVPARLDRLPWSRFHWLVISALGITWILDGLEVTLVGSLSGAISNRASLGLSDSETGFAASFYLMGAIVGALGFGYLTDRLGRKKLFTVTVALYAIATVATGCAWNFWSFAIFRMLTGAGIGGEYAAINSAIQELIPARFRGWTDIAVNGTFWLGAALGAGSSLVLLDPALLSPDVGWRLAFGIGGLLGILVIFLRRFLPESPRWLMTHGRLAEADAVTGEIERRVAAEFGKLPPIAGKPVRLRARGPISPFEVARIVLTLYPRRAVVGLALMGAQAFFYNAVFFTYALVLARIYHVPAPEVGRYILPFALGNFAGPLLLGRLFDSLGRKIMIAATYGLSGLMMAVVAVLFARGMLDATTQTAAWTAIFFVASAASSSAYLTVGESFPLELRALVIALFYAVGTAIGGVAGPAVFGALVQSGSPEHIAWGYFASAVLMMGAAAIEAWLGIASERQPLEAVAAPLSLAE